MEVTSNPVANKSRRLRNRFHIVKTLGQGTYGKVKLAIERDTGREVAIKSIRKSRLRGRDDLNRIKREIKIISSLFHPYIINFKEVFENREKIVILMEHASRGELWEYLNSTEDLTEHEIRRIFRQVASAVYHCHKNNIVHRDLKLENILLDDQLNVKIADFGLSSSYSYDCLLNTYCGSPLYASPEIVNGQPYQGPEVDCWSLGVLLYTLVYRTMPFDGSDFNKLKQQISEGDYYEPEPPSEASELIRWMLTVNPKKRATIEDICTHQWVTKGYPDPVIGEASIRKSPVVTKLIQMDDSLQLTSDDSANDSDRSSDSPIMSKRMLGAKKLAGSHPKSILKKRLDAEKRRGDETAVDKTEADNEEEEEEEVCIEGVGCIVRKISVKRDKTKRGILKRKGKYNKYRGADSGCVMDEHPDEDKNSEGATESDASQSANDTGKGGDSGEGHLVRNDSIDHGVRDLDATVSSSGDEMEPVVIRPESIKTMNIISVVTSSVQQLAVEEKEWQADDSGESGGTTRGVASDGGSGARANVGSSGAQAYVGSGSAQADISSSGAAQAARAKKKGILKWQSKYTVVESSGGSTDSFDLLEVGGSEGQGRPGRHTDEGKGSSATVPAMSQGGSLQTTVQQALKICKNPDKHN